MKSESNYRQAYRRTEQYRYSNKSYASVRSSAYGRTGGSRRYYTSSSRNGRVGYGSYISYNPTSVAHDYSYGSYENVGKKKAVKKRQQQKEIVQLSLPKTYATIAVLFIFTLSLLCIYASNSNRRDRIASMREELSVVQDNNQYLEASIEDNLDFEKIEQEAVKLGLQKPAEYQLMKISVPKESYTVQYDTQPQVQEQSFFEYIKSWFKD